ncbi:MAG TPA: formate/nitrite transporter family protein [Micropruina sp.]|nr:formate/nitrite transporter family protein [Micropruina sp.]
MTTPDTSHLFPGKQFISTVLEALDTKTAMSGGLRRRYLQRSGMAGIIIGIFYTVNYAVIAAFRDVDQSLRPIGVLVGALMFGWALVFIYYSKSELLTSNMMIVSIGAYHRRTRWSQALWLLVLCFAGNLLGGLLLGVVEAGSSLASGTVLLEMTSAVDHKLAYVSAGPVGWLDLLMRALLCNFMINLAMLLVYNGLIKEDITKCLAMVVSVFVFAFLGLEHSVANTVLFTMMGLRGLVDFGLAAGNVAIALIGNFIGGGVLIGFYYAYANDDRKYGAGGKRQGV